MHGWTDPLDSETPYRRLAPPADEATTPPALWDADGRWPGDDRPAAGHRRHRAAPRISRSVTLAGAAAVATLVVAVGAGALLLPASDPARTNPAAAEGATGSTVARADTGSVPAETPAAPGDTAPTPAPNASTALKAPPAVPAREATTTPARPPAKAPARPGGSAERATVGGDVEQVVTLVNEQRLANRCGNLQVNDKLATAAQAHSEDQAAHGTMSHNGSDGSSPWDRAGRVGYSQAISENVAVGYRTPAAVMAGWMNSPDHRANILNCTAVAIGVGVAAAGDGTLYWTQMFGTLV